MKAYAIKVTEPNIPTLGQEEDPATYFQLSKNATQIIRCDESGIINLYKYSIKSSSPSLTDVF
jgi:hypothetical protein